MKHFIITFICIASLLLINESCLAYDFTALTPEGQCLYYSIIGLNAVEVSSPTNNTGWSNIHPKPIGSLTIPGHVTYQTNTFEVVSIGFQAVEYCDSLTAVTIPNSVKYIGRWAFWGCPLTTINFPETAVYVEDHSFHGTTWYDNQPSGTLVYIGNTLYKYKGWSNIDEDYSVIIPSYTNSIAGGAFSTDSYWGPDTVSENRHLVSVIIPNSVEHIGTNAFSHCSLTNVSLPNSLELIGMYAFQDNPIKEITIPRSVKVIGMAAFGYNDSLRKVNLLAEHLEDSTINLYSYNPFIECPNLHSINFGNTVSYISDRFLFGSQTIDTIVIPNSVCGLGEYVFAGCDGLKSITIGAGIKSIPNSTFSSNLHELKELSFNAVNCTSGYVLSNCNSNFQLSIGSNVKSIPPNFLQFCSSYNNTIILPEGLQLIGAFAFCGLGVSGEIELPSTIDSIGISAFSFCNNLSGIKCYATIPPKLGGVIGNVNIPIKVPCNCVPAYLSADIWCNYYSVEEMGGCDFSVNITVNDPSMGTVIGSGTYSQGTTITIEATPYSGCHFERWSDNNTQNPRNIIVNDNVTLTAYFVADAENYSVNLSVNDPSMGVVTGGGTYAQGTTITIVATPNTGYHFERWSDNNPQNPRSITVNCNITLTAIFAADNGIEDVDVSGVIVYSKDYHIFIDNANGEEVSVFSIEGRRIATSNNTTNLVSILVPVAGVYIVKVGNYLVRKVIVK